MRPSQRSEDGNRALMPLTIALDYRPALLSSAGIGRAVRELAATLAEQPDLELHLFGHSLARARRPVA